MSKYVFPVAAWKDPQTGRVRPATDGITKRELFAAMAMQGAISMMDRLEGEAGKSLGESIVTMSVDYADALIAELAKETK